MPLGTLDRTPPPFFRQGPSARTKLILFTSLAIFLAAADARFKLTGPIRMVLATALLPVQRVVDVPVNSVRTMSDYIAGLQQARERENDIRVRMVMQAEKAARAEQLALENQRLRALLDLRPEIRVGTIAAEVLYEAPDPYSRKLFIDRGTAQGVVTGSPVMNESGLLGQVTQAYPLSSEVTLMTDRNAAVPVINDRTEQRSAAFGSGAEGLMELRYMTGNADVQVGDRLVTSGVDGIYPRGLAVAEVTAVDRRSEATFAHIALKPYAQADGVRHVLVLKPVNSVLGPLAMPGPDDTPAQAEAASSAQAAAAASAAADPSMPDSGASSTDGAASATPAASGASVPEATKPSGPPPLRATPASRPVPAARVLPTARPASGAGR